MMSSLLLPVAQSSPGDPTMRSEPRLALTSALPRAPLNWDAYTPPRRFNPLLDGGVDSTAAAAPDLQAGGEAENVATKAWADRPHTKLWSLPARPTGAAGGTGGAASPVHRSGAADETPWL